MYYGNDERNSLGVLSHPIFCLCTKSMKGTGPTFIEFLRKSVFQPENVLRKQQAEHSNTYTRKHTTKYIETHRNTPKHILSL